MSRSKRRVGHITSAPDGSLVAAGHGSPGRVKKAAADEDPLPPAANGLCELVQGCQGLLIWDSRARQCSREQTPTVGICNLHYCRKASVSSGVLERHIARGSEVPSANPKPPHVGGALPVCHPQPGGQRLRSVDVGCSSGACTAAVLKIRSLLPRVSISPATAEQSMATACRKQQELSAPATSTYEREPPCGSRCRKRSDAGCGPATCIWSRWRLTG